jgi:hypothetical protein
MAYRVPFHQETFTAEVPGDERVEFDLSAVSSSSLVLLKALMAGMASLAFLRDPGGDETKRASEQLKSVGPAFVEGVDAVRGLTVPDALARRVLLRETDSKETDDVPVKTGAQFARVAPYLPAIALQVGFKLIRLSGEEGAGIKPDYFGLCSGSPAKPTSQSGTAEPAPSTPSGTADAGTTQVH